MRIAIVNNDYFSVFPQRGNGGIEAAVETWAKCLHKHGHDFFVITPKRHTPIETPFEVIDTKSLPCCEKSPSNYINDVSDILAGENFDIVWANSSWSVNFAKNRGSHDAPVIINIHDGVEHGAKGIISLNPHVYYRFLTKNHYDRCVSKDWEAEKSFFCYYGFWDDEYDYCKDKENYALWVASLFYGFEAKGLDLFINLAIQNPSCRYFAYGVGPSNITEYVQQLSDKIPNFYWKGELKRGQEHKEVFKKANVFYQLSRLPESFGRTIVESQSKGTPVIGLHHKDASTREVIGDSLGTYPNVEKYNNYQFIFEKDYKHAFDYAQKFKAENEMNTLLEKSKLILEKGKL